MAKALDIVPVGEWGYFTLPRPMTIAGPCSAESEKQVMDTYIEKMQQFREAVDAYDDEKIRQLIEEANRIKKIIR